MPFLDQYYQDPQQKSMWVLLLSLKNSQYIFISLLSCFLLVEVFFGIQGEPFSYLAKSPRVSTTTRTRCRRWWPRRCWRRRGRSRRRRTCSTTSGQRLDRSIEVFCRKSGLWKIHLLFRLVSGKRKRGCLWSPIKCLSLFSFILIFVFLIKRTTTCFSRTVKALLCLYYYFCVGEIQTYVLQDNLT